MYDTDLSPRNLISIRPNRKIIENINKKHKCNTINIYVDLKNVLRSLYVQDVSEKIMNEGAKMGGTSSMIFQSVISLYSDWMDVCKQNDLNIKMYVFSDINTSIYHQALDKRYKSSRTITKSSNMLTEDVIEVRRKNTELAYNVYNKLPNMYMFYLKSLESDFIPYWLITRIFKECENIYHIILSNDKDMFQALLYPRTCQIYRMNNTTYELTENTAFSRYYRLNKETDVFKYNKLNDAVKNLNKGYLLASMAMSGDYIDDVEGLPGVKERTSLHLLSDSEVNYRILGTPEELEERIISGGNFLRDDVIWDIGVVGKKWMKLKEKLTTDNINEICTKSYKLISYECLCRWLEDKDTIKKLELIKEMNGVMDKFNEEQIPNSKVLMSSVRNLGDCKLTEYELQNLFL